MKRVQFISIILSCLIFCSTFTAAEIPAEENPAEKEKSYGIVPVPVPFYGPETGWGLAATVITYWNADRSVARPDTLSLVAIYTQEKQSLFAVDTDLYFLGDTLLLETGFGYSDWKNTFYGIGGESPAGWDSEYEEDYTSDSIRGHVGAAVKIVDNLYAGARWYYSDTTIKIDDPTGWMAASSMIGGEGGIVSGPGAILKYDSRNEAFYPTEGFFIEAEYSVFSDSTGSSFSFDSLQTDLRSYFSIRQNHILAMQVKYDYTSGDTPFYRLPSLADREMMRGIEAGKYIDNLRYAAQAEYRFPVWNRFGGVVFAGAGHVFSTHHDMFDETTFAGGFGIRYLLEKNRKINMRLDFGFDQDGEIKFYFNLRESF
jgi:outer membrane protein assembly factor BamA